MVTSYKVNGIPSKFIIDKNAVIRFYLMGFDGSNEASVEELSAMIDLAKNSTTNDLKIGRPEKRAASFVLYILHSKTIMEMTGSIIDFSG